VMFHYECALPQTNTFVNNQTTLLLQAQANEVWELMHHNRILVALQHAQFTPLPAETGCETC